eukprot:CAMPEP_0183387812 /NCGR_PEP_ID=MMETSP0370-20130417/3576_1 /TAXON_ID=268820 /ORGANISM="Peridinium aciculiferum, Strain PAER-2" /LENGTH=90 /DNA_ID=CAMNT_0025566539 /DNA_START=25 /DNA_END=294 /DNA_ORIENTATION=+
MRFKPDGLTTYAFNKAFFPRPAYAVSGLNQVLFGNGCPTNLLWFKYSKSQSLGTLSMTAASRLWKFGGNRESSSKTRKTSCSGVCAANLR